ncbi:MAG: prepilin-type N-terminal cleavage/methylation domain-containing protein [Helicobacteraceae bacterium]|jgi:prepilin-type N-terminal cleavage/methylation domain-containing protein|nr:prepilin-type N-terminal cleavage/methylation domain-containing protein [Helicobacteraceae bacterium]
MLRGAFTFIEIVAVVVIVAILSSIAVSRFTENSELYLAIDQTLSHIRYTQHLAVMSDPYDSSDQNWIYRRWLIRFSNQGKAEYGNGWTYSIFLDSESDPNISPKASECAKDPQTGRLMSGGFGDKIKTVDGMPELALTRHWHITAVSLRGCTSTIAFDAMGRPYNHTSVGPDIKRTRITDVCRITFTHAKEGSASICIHPESGYAEMCG